MHSVIHRVICWIFYYGIIAICLLLNPKFTFIEAAVDYEFTIEEGTSSGVRVGILDQNRFGENFNRPIKFQFTLFTTSQIVQKSFIVDQQNGVIRTATTIDREELCLQNGGGYQRVRDPCSIQFKVQASEVMFNNNNNNKNNKQEENNNAFSVLIRVTILIEDKNDHLPTFENNEVHLSIPESSTIGSHFLLPSARDLDSVRFGVVSYSMKQINLPTEPNLPDPMKIFKVTYSRSDNVMDDAPKLVQLMLLDREIHDRYAFKLIAIDGGGQSAETLIRITILDRNDNAPKWIGIPYNVNVSECVTPTRNILLLKAEDPDEGINAKLRFELNPLASDFMKKIFFISGNQLILSSSLSYLSLQELHVPIVVKDGGDLENTTIVTVNIIDCNDHEPIIKILPPTTSPDKMNQGGSLYVSSSDIPVIKENNLDELHLATVHVSDVDSGVNGEVQCKLSDTRFYLREISEASDRDKIYYILKSKEISFDREERPRVSLRIVCHDMPIGGIQRKTSERTLHIQIKDINDNAPSVREKYQFHLAENNIQNQFIARIYAFDADEGKNQALQFTMLNVTTNGPHKDDLSSSSYFDLSTSGDLYALTIFDREAQDRYDIGIRVCDQGEDPGKLCTEAIINVIITDVNDNPPILLTNFETNGQAWIVEESFANSPKTHVFGQLNASDLDLGANGTVRFFLDGGTQTNLHGPQFRLTEKGFLTVSGILDREQSPSYRLSIILMDTGQPVKSAQHQIIIHLSDLNDNQPILTYPGQNETLNISQDLTVGSTVVVFQASDPDQGENGSVSFFLQKGYFNHFFTLQESGELFLSKSLHELGYVSDNGYTLNILLKDNGRPNGLSTIARVRLFILKSLKPLNENYGLGGQRGGGGGGGSDQMGSGSSLSGSLIDGNSKDGGGGWSSSSDNNREQPPRGLLILLGLSLVIIVAFFFIVFTLLFFSMRRRRGGCLQRSQPGGRSSSTAHEGSTSLDGKCDTMIVDKNHSAANVGLDSVYAHYKTLQNNTMLRNETLVNFGRRQSGLRCYERSPQSVLTANVDDPQSYLMAPNDCHLGSIYYTISPQGGAEAINYPGVYNEYDEDKNNCCMNKQTSELKSPKLGTKDSTTAGGGGGGGHNSGVVTSTFV